MFSHRLSVAALCVASLTLGSHTFAQDAPVRIGITAQSPSLLKQEDNCRVRTCPLTIAPIGAQATAAGGTAFDGTIGGVWVSNGLETSLVDGESCRELCAPQRLLQDRAFVTGLAVYEPGRLLIATDSANRVHFFRIDCPVARAIQVCSMVGVVPGNHTLGGVAVDDVTGDLFLSSADFSSPTSPGNLLWVTNISRPCQPQCMGRIPDCGATRLVPVHGVAYDGCTDTVWVTDGLRQVAIDLDRNNCSMRVQQCCNGGFTDPLAGLCIQPARSQATGRGCLERPCRACPNPEHVLRGAPMVGNPSFALDGQGLPVGSAVLAVFNGGRCQSPGTPVPGLCGPLAVPFAVPPVAIGPRPAVGSAFCDGTVSFSVPIPPNPALCDAILCSQLVGICQVPGSPLGTFVTSARQWRITYH